MNYTQVTPTPLKPGYGLIFQGGLIDTAIAGLPAPTAIIRMNCDISQNEEGWLSLPNLCFCYCVDIEDNPQAVLSDNILLALTDACISLLKSGINLYIHCVAGVSRSTYCDLAIHMRLLNLSFDDALARLLLTHPSAVPNSGFAAHLRRLEPVLRQGNVA